MKNSFLIATRELKERVGSRTYLLFSVLGPAIVLGMIYVLFAMGGQSKVHWNVLVSDPANVLGSKMMPSTDENITFAFADAYIETEEFAKAKKYEGYDAMLEIHEKILGNKSTFVFYREKPSIRMQSKLKFFTERRLEEVMVKQFTDLTVKDFRKIKQPLNFAFRDVYDPYNESADMRGWVGFFFGVMIFVFIFLFGMTILRSVSNEKANRVVEVLLASVKPRQLMMGKILGIGFSAFIQFAIWIILIGFGLYAMRETLFPDMLDASNLASTQLLEGLSESSYQEKYFAAREYNEFVALVYDRIQYTNVIGFFIMFFVGGYLFYGALFAAIGATMGSESDGQQFVIPIVLLLIAALYSGYYVLNYPHAPISSFLHYFPFTSPVVVMVKLAYGYEPGHAYEIYVSLLTVIVSAIVMVLIASRLFKNGILQFGHRLRFKHLMKWLKSS
ncbi:MAG: ABC transporter permease [Crocinitomicaceae bacterium]